MFYGLFPKGLQKTLKFKAGLSKSIDECCEIISNLKAWYKDLGKWQHKVKKQAAEDGYTETYLGRRRYLPDITSANWGKKSFAQRCAINTPIQGTAADILKLAMGKIQRPIRAFVAKAVVTGSRRANLRSTGRQCSRTSNRNCDNTHLDNIAIVCLGDYYSNIAVFGQNEKKHGTML